MNPDPYLDPDRLLAKKIGAVTSPAAPRDQAKLFSAGSPMQQARPNLDELFPADTHDC